MRLGRAAKSKIDLTVKWLISEYSLMLDVGLMPQILKHPDHTNALLICLFLTTVNFLA